MDDDGTTSDSNTFCVRQRCKRLDDYEKVRHRYNACRPETHIRNPLSGRCVDLNGPTGNLLLKAYAGKEIFFTDIDRERISKHIETHKSDDKNNRRYRTKKPCTGDDRFLNPFTKRCINRNGLTYKKIMKNIKPEKTKKESRDNITENSNTDNTPKSVNIQMKTPIALMKEAVRSVFEEFVLEMSYRKRGSGLIRRDDPGFEITALFPTEKSTSDDALFRSKIKNLCIITIGEVHDFDVSKKIDTYKKRRQTVNELQIAVRERTKELMTDDSSNRGNTSRITFPRITNFLESKICWIDRRYSSQILMDIKTGRHTGQNQYIFLRDHCDARTRTCTKCFNMREQLPCVASLKHGTNTAGRRVSKFVLDKSFFDVKNFYRINHFYETLRSKNFYRSFMTDTKVVVEHNDVNVVVEYMRLFPEETVFLVELFWKSVDRDCLNHFKNFTVNRAENESLFVRFKKLSSLIVLNIIMLCNENFIQENQPNTNTACVAHFTDLLFLHEFLFLDKSTEHQYAFFWAGVAHTNLINTLFETELSFERLTMRLDRNSTLFPKPENLLVANIKSDTDDAVMDSFDNNFPEKRRYSVSDNTELVRYNIRKKAVKNIRPYIV